VENYRVDLQQVARAIVCEDVSSAAVEKIVKPRFLGFTPKKLLKTENSKF